MRLRFPKRVGILAAVGITLALAGCAPATPGAMASPGVQSSSSAPAAGGSSGGAGDVDVCSLLTTDQASTLANDTLTAGKPSVIATGQDQCAWDSTGPSVGLTVIVYRADSGVSWSILKSSNNADTSVSGVGDRAATDGVVNLVAESGPHLIVVAESNADGRIAVAKSILGALR